MARERELGTEQLIDYLATNLSANLVMGPSSLQSRLPIVLSRKFKLLDSFISGRRVVFAVLGAKAQVNPKEVQKQLDVISRMADHAAVVVLVAPRLPWPIRARLKEMGIQFVIPDREIFLPNFQLISTDRGHSEVNFGDKFTPSAQVILFGYLLDRTEGAINSSELAASLHITPMSAGRGLDQLEELDLVETSKEGRERHFRFRHDKRELFERARKHIASPVKATKYVASGFVDDLLVLAGDTALSEMTMLNQKSLTVYAVVANAWKGLVFSRKLIETREETADFIVETWHYDPVSLSSGPLADPLSIYAQFRNSDEPRVKQAVGEVLETMKWWRESKNSEITWQDTSRNM